MGFFFGSFDWFFGCRSIIVRNDDITQKTNAYFLNSGTLGQSRQKNGFSVFCQSRSPLSFGEIFGLLCYKNIFQRAFPGERSLLPLSLTVENFVDRLADETGSFRVGDQTAGHIGAFDGFLDPQRNQVCREKPFLYPHRFGKRFLADIYRGLHYCQQRTPVNRFTAAEMAGITLLESHAFF